MLIYFLVIFILIIINLHVFKNKKVKNYMNAGVLFFMLAFRYDVGWDYRWYFELGDAKYLLKYSFFEKFTPEVYLDPNLFQYIRIEFFNKVIYKIVWYYNNPQIFIAITSFLLIFFIMKGLNKNENYSGYPWILFYGFPLFLFSFMGLIRQSIAVSIIFYSYYFIKKRKLLKFITCIIIASLFHKSAVFILPLFFLYNVKLSYKVIISIMATSFFSLNILKIILETKLFSEYAIYVKDSIGLGGNVIYYLIILLDIILLILYNRLILINTENKFLINTVLFGSYIYIALIKLGHLGPRISVYFLIYMLYLIEDCFKIFKNKNFIKSVYIMINIIFVCLILYGDTKQKIRSQYIPYETNIFFKRGIEWEK